MVVDELIDKYQYYTCADMTKLVSAGCSHACISLEKAVADYVRSYLEKGEHLTPS